MTRAALPPAATPRLGLGTFEWAAIALGIVLAHAFFGRNGVLPVAYDDYDYALAGRDILDNGLFRKFHDSQIRIYGYPLFLSFAHGLGDISGAAFRWIVFELQLALYLAAALFLRGVLRRRDRAFAGALFCAVVLNGYALLYASEILTESLSLTLLVAAAASWLWLQREPLRLAPLLVGAAAAAFAVMVRPANLFLLGAWIVGCLIVLGPLMGTRRGMATAGARLAAVALVTVAMSLPQWINNVRNWQRHTPLIAADLQTAQQRWGIENLKYATALPPVPEPQVWYRNPLAAGTVIDDRAPLGWYVEYPGRGLATLALHLFAMTDQDLLFTYARDLDPWWRSAHGLFNHAVVALGLFGLVMWWQSVCRRRLRAGVEAAALATLLVVFNGAVYATTAVEMRFGLTLLSVLFPCAAYALMRLRACDNRRRVMAAVLIAAYAAGGLYLSGWVRSHSPVIVEATTS